MRSPGLRARLVLLVVVALLPVFGLMVYSSVLDRRAALELASSALMSRAQLAATEPQRLVERTAQLLGDIAGGPSIQDTRLRDAAGQLCVAYLRNLLQRHRDYLEIGVADLEGMVACAAPDQPSITGLAERSFFRAVVAGKSLAVGEYRDGAPQAGLTFGVPVRNADGKLVGVAFATIRARALAEAFSRSTPPDGITLTLTDRKGRVLVTEPAGGAPGHVADGLLADPAALEAILQRRSGLQQAQDAAGEERVYAAVPVSEHADGPLFLVASQPRAQMLAHPRRILWTELTLLLLTLSGGALAAWWFGNRLVVRPARALLDEANAVAAGHLDAHTGRGAARYPGEIGQLGEAFTRMVASLRAHQTGLDNALRHADKQQALLRLIIDSMREGVIAVDTQGKFLLFNPAAARIVPPPREGETLHTWRAQHQLLTADGATLVDHDQRPMARALLGEQIDAWRALVRVGDATGRVVSISCRPFRDARGEIIGVVQVFTDVTEGERTEGLLRESEALFRSLFDHAASGIAITTPDARFVRVNRAYCAQVGYTEAELLTMGVPQVTHPDDRVRNMALQQELATGARESVVFEKRHLRKDGVVNWSRVSLSSVRGADGELLHVVALTDDITASRTAEQALRASEARFRELAENIPDVFYTIDTSSGRVIYVSPAYEAVWDRTRESLYANPRALMDSVHPEDRAEVRANLERQSRGEITSAEYRIVRPDGRVRWILDQSYPVHADPGMPSRSVGLASDITARKQASVVLAETNRALRMLSRCNEALIRIDKEHDLLEEICRVAVEIGGYRMAWVGYAQHDAEFSIRPMASAGVDDGYLAEISLCWSQDSPRGRGPAGQTVRGGKPVVCADIFAEGSGFFYQEAARQRGYRSVVFLPLSGPDGSFGLLGLYGAEVNEPQPTELRQLQELTENLAFGIANLRSRASRERMEDAVLKVAAGVSASTGNAFFEQLARSMAMALGAQVGVLARLKPGEPASASTLATVVDGRAVDNFDYALDGTPCAELILSWECVVRDGLAAQFPNAEVLSAGDMRAFVGRRLDNAAGQPVGLLWVMFREPLTDIAFITSTLQIFASRAAAELDRQRAEQDILQLNAGLEERVRQRTAQLEAANKELEAFSYSIAHDLRSPLSAVDGFSHLLDMTLKDAASEKSRHYLDRIRTGVRQMGELTDALLSLAQVSRAALRWEPVDLGSIAASVVERLRESDPKRLAVVQIAPDLQVQGDPRLLRLVLENLLGNAWKFSAKRERTEIAFTSEVSSGGERVFVVRDNGAGFDMAYAQKLFGTFQRLHSPSEFAGTGIGLANVQRIVAKHGGRVWAHGVPDQGAEFSFTLAETPPQ